MLVGAAFAVLVLTGLEPVEASGICGGISDRRDRRDPAPPHGPAEQCFSNDNSRNGAVLISPGEEVQA